MKLRKNNKKGFTIVELVIVIAVIGILTAILVPVFINLTNRANEASDNSLVKNLNTALKMVENDPSAEDEDTHQKLSGKNNTMQDVVLDLKYEGYYLENLVAKSGQDLLWDASKNEFFLSTESTEANVNYWKIVNEVPANANQKYSYYAGKNFNTTVPDLKYGFDVGYNDGISSLKYVGPGVNPGQEVVIRTNGGTLTIDAVNDTVKHYGDAQDVTLTAVGTDSYYENGTVKQVNIKKGRLVLTNSEDASVETVYLQATGDNYDSIILATQSGAELPNLIARDNVPLPTGTDVKTVVTIQSNVNEAGENPEKVETIDLYAEKDVKEKDNGYNVSDLGLLIVEAISSEAQTQAAEQITNPEVVAKVSETKAATVVKTEKELTDALNAKAKYIIVADSFDTTKAFLIQGSTTIEGAKLLDGTYPTITSKATTQSEKRGFRINTSNIDVNLRNLTIDVRTNVTSDGGYPRGLQIDSNKTGIKLSVDNCNISATHYAFNVCNGADVEAVFTNSHLLGYGALNLWNASYAVIVKNCTLEGIQNGAERFAVVVLEGDTTYQTTMHSTAIAVKLSQTEIIATSNKAEGTEAFIGFNSNAISNVVEIDNCTMVSNGIGKTPSFYDSGKSNKIIANCGTYDYEEWEEVSGDYFFDPSTINWTVNQVISWAESNGFTNIYENDGIVYYTIYIPAGNVIDESYEIPAGYKAVVSNDKSTFSIVKK